MRDLIAVRRLSFCLLVLCCSAPGSSSLARPVVDEWRYTLRRPAEGWHQADFDDTAWSEGFGGFGRHGTPGSRVGTTWATKRIWLRKWFELPSIPANPALMIHHDEPAKVYINGKPVSVLKTLTEKYTVILLSKENRKALQLGQNIMAVHGRQTYSGQFIDVHLVDADNVPELPEPKRNSKPFVSELITEWGAAVTPDKVWTEYPRPQLKRENWTNLNGNWEYEITPVNAKEIPLTSSGKILVPYCLESKLSGIQRLLHETEALWYRRTFRAKKANNMRLLIHFEAVDYRCEVFVNDQSVGTHVGGHTPFSFDITGAIKDGENALVVRVEDATEEYQLRGKQALNPRGIWYTQVSGIWQTVWLEEVPALYVERVKIDTNTSGKVSVKVVPNGRISGELNVEAIVRHEGNEVAREASSDSRLILQIENPKLWSPDSPVLYNLELHVNDDLVHSYFGIREVGKVKDHDGHWRFTLNGKPIFHWGPLDQGWWPDGLLTPPSDEAMLYDIEWLKAAGFNMIRKHIKVEPRRYYFHCDRLGMMVWQDHVNGGVGGATPTWTRLKPDPLDAKWPATHHGQFMLELDRMITMLQNHPSIVSWVPFNERWGQHKTMEVGRWIAERDPSRLINIASGGNFWSVGDIVDAHNYPQPEFPFDASRDVRFDDYIKVIGEFGGHGYPVMGHLWDANRRNWGYGDLPQDEAEYKQRYSATLNRLNELRNQGIAAGVYTQTTDVEGEINGLMSYDRKVSKIPAQELAKMHKVLFEPIRSQTPQIESAVR